MQESKDAHALRRTASAHAPDAAGGKSRRTLALLLQDIARCRTDIARREAAQADLQRRLLAEARPWEEKRLAIRIEIFRILGKHLKSGRLNRKACKALELALYDLAEELETGFGADLSRDRQWIFEEEIPAYGREPAGGGRSPEAFYGDGHAEEDEEAGRASAYRESDFPERAAGTRPDWNAPNERPGIIRPGRKQQAAGEASAGDIRALYLLLARALHPDKESDLDRLQTKTAWMQKVTAAYAERNLAALLDILATNPLEAVEPYLSQAPAATVQGFVKRLRRELGVLRAALARLEAGTEGDPFLSVLLKGGNLNEIALNTYLAQARKEVSFMRQRRDAYRTAAGVDGLVEALRSHDWRELL